jgi:hypothetical protein
MATAKLIMQHPDMIKDFARNNKMVKKLVKSMIKSELALDLAEAAQKLNHWLNVIHNDYNKKNSRLPSAEDTTLLEIVQQQSVLINQLVLSNQNMGEDFPDSSYHCPCWQLGGGGCQPHLWQDQD